MKARRIAAVAVGAMLVLGLTACVSSRTAAVGASQDGPGGQLVGVTMPTKQSERWVQDGNNVKAQLEAAGYTVDLQYAENGLMAFNNLAGEPITGLAAGRPLFLRSPGSTFDLATFMRTQLYAALATLRIGMDVLTKDENVGLDAMFAHGGLFTTKGVAQRFLAAAIDTPVAVGSTASEGGPWGMAVLAAFLTRRRPGRASPTTCPAGCSPAPNWTRSSPTRPTSPVSTASCSGTSRRCRCSGLPSNTAERGLPSESSAQWRRLGGDRACEVPRKGDA